MRADIAKRSKESKRERNLVWTSAAYGFRRMGLPFSHPSGLGMRAFSELARCDLPRLTF